MPGNAVGSLVARWSDIQRYIPESSVILSPEMLFGLVLSGVLIPSPRAESTPAGELDAATPGSCCNDWSVVGLARCVSVVPQRYREVAIRSQGSAVSRTGGM